MSAIGSPAPVRLAGPDFRKYALRSALIAGLGLFGCVLPYPPIIAENAYPKPRVPAWAADAYWVILAASILALIWALARPRRIGVRLDERGIKVSNYFRTYRLSWAQVNYFADGFATCLDLTASGAVQRGWALTVMLRDGRGITASATMGRLLAPRS